MSDLTQSKGISHTALANAMQAHLETLRESICHELATIPPPVPACDVNFNRLLEDRAGVVDELQKLAKLRAAAYGATDLLGFARACAWLDSGMKARIEQVLGATRD
jgi:hypothetical protein